MTSTSPVRRARPGAPLRGDADQQAAADVAGRQRANEIVVDPYGGWNEPTNRAAAILRADPTELARVGRRGWRKKSARAPAGARGRERRAAAPRPPRRPTHAALRAGPPTPLGARPPDGDLVYTASSMPIRDQEAFLAAGDTDALFLCNRGANGIDGLDLIGIGAAHASGRPTTIVTGDLGLLHDVGGLAALRDVSTPSASSSSTTAAAASSTSCPRPKRWRRRSSRRCSAPHAGSTSGRRRRSSASPIVGSTPWPNCPTPSTPAPV